jgi:RNA polymerase sigma factor (sigma-70 family)
VTPTEVNALIVDYQRAKMPARRKRLLDRLVRAHLPLIKRLVRKAAHAEKSTEEFDDLLQAGCIGFVTALDKFDTTKGFAVSTYAAHWIRHEVQQATRAARPVRLPRIRLRKDERDAALERVRENPDVTPGDIGLTPVTLEQVKYSMGLQFVSSDTQKGERALERSDAATPRAGAWEAKRALFAACARMSFLEVRACRLAIGVDREPAPMRPVRLDQCAWRWRDRIPDEFRPERCMLAAAQRIDSNG